jgi:hypothetical protein
MSGCWNSKNGLIRTDSGRCVGSEQEATKYKISLPCKSKDHVRCADGVCRAERNCPLYDGCPPTKYGNEFH